MNRFLFTAGNQVERLKLALTMLYLLPGQPLVYFGTETGLSQPRSIHDPDSIGFDQARLPMNWQEAEAYADLAGLMRKMAAFRERFPQLAEADWHLLLVDDQKEVALWRVNMPHDQLFVALNRSQITQQIPFALNEAKPNKLIHIGEQDTEVNLNSGMLTLQPESVLIYKVTG
jgi:glycosidase